MLHFSEDDSTKSVFCIFCDGENTFTLKHYLEDDPLHCITAHSCSKHVNNDKYKWMFSNNLDVHNGLWELEMGEIVLRVTKNKSNELQDFITSVIISVTLEYNILLPKKQWYVSYTLSYSSHTCIKVKTHLTFIFGNKYWLLDSCVWWEMISYSLF